MSEKRRFAPTAVGGSSLLTIFGILCLTVFALLCLTTVLSDQRLQEGMLTQVEQYYAADVMAEEVLARIRHGEIPEGVEKNGSVYSYSCPVSDTQNLEVTVTVNEDGSYAVEQWQAVTTVEWETDLGLDLWLS